MSETFWEAGTEQSEGEAQNQGAGGPGTLALSLDDFKALEERILRAVDMVKRERLARAAAEERATQAEAQAHDHGTKLEQLEKEMHALKDERDHVRQRVERLLTQLDALEL
jgi:hypothetical protein